jgi:hypothetical protein
MSTIRLYRLDPDTQERELLGVITESQLDFLIDNLEEEFLEDDDYWIDSAGVEFLRDLGADAELLQLLERAVAGTGEGADISYQVE